MTGAVVALVRGSMTDRNSGGENSCFGVADHVARGGDNAAAQTAWILSIQEAQGVRTRHRTRHAEAQLERQTTTDNETDGCLKKAYRGLFIS